LIRGNNILSPAAIVLCAAAGAGALQAAGEVYLKNLTGLPVTVIRIPNAMFRLAEHPEVLMGGNPEVHGPFKPLPAHLTLVGNEPVERPTTLTVQPGATAKFLWAQDPVGGAVTHLGIRIGDSAQRCILVYRVPPAGPPTLEACLSSGPMAAMSAVEEAGRRVHLLFGAVRPGPCLEAGPVGPDPELDPGRPWVGRRGAPGPGRGGDAGAVETKGQFHGRVSVLNRSGADLSLVFPGSERADAGPAIHMRYVSWDPPMAGPWEPVPSGRGAMAEFEVPLPAGHRIFLALARPFKPGEQHFLSVKKAGDPRVCQVTYLPGPDGKATLRPTRLQDRAVLNCLGPFDADLTLTADSFLVGHVPIPSAP